MAALFSVFPFVCRTGVDVHAGRAHVVGVSNDHTPDGALPLRLGFLRRLKWWVWFTEVIHPSDLQVTLGWAGVIGFGGALTSIGFRYVTSELHKLMTGSTAPGLVESFMALSWWHRLMIPGVGRFARGIGPLFRNALARWRDHGRLHGSGRARRRQDLDPAQPREMSFGHVYDRFGRIDRA